METCDVCDAAPAREFYYPIVQKPERLCELCYSRLTRFDQRSMVELHLRDTMRELIEALRSTAQASGPRKYLVTLITNYSYEEREIEQMAHSAQDACDQARIEHSPHSLVSVRPA